MHKAVFVLGLAACAGHERTIDVTAMSGDQPEPGAIVIAHHANGDRFADVHVDANGHAVIRVDDEDLVTLVYPADERGTQLFTIAPTGDVVVHGRPPPAVTSPPVLGRLDIAPTANVDADLYNVESSCGWTWATTFPQTFDVGAGCLGRDGQVPIIVTAYKQGQPVAYVAGLAALTNGSGTFAPTSWLPYAPNAPIVTTGVSPHVEWKLSIDGVPVGPGDELSGAGLSPPGLPVDGAEIRAWIAGPGRIGQTVTRSLSSAPSQIALGPDDFLPQVPATVVASGLPSQGDPTAPLRFTWASSDIGADVTTLTLYYVSRYGHDVTWVAVLPPDARGLDCLPFEGELDTLAPRDDPGLTLAYIDSPDLRGYDDVLAAGIATPDLNAMIVPPPTAGELRSSSTGYGP
jgi:hypothetical protein